MSPTFTSESIFRQLLFSKTSFKTWWPANAKSEDGKCVCSGINYARDHSLWGALRALEGEPRPQWRGRKFSTTKSPLPLYSTKPTSKHLVCALREDFLNFQSTKTKKLRKIKGFAWSLKMHFVAQKLKRMHRCKCWATGAEYIWLNGCRRRGDHNLQSCDSLLKRTSEHLQCERCVCFSPVLTQQCEWCVCFSPVLLNNVNGVFASPVKVTVG